MDQNFDLRVETNLDLREGEKKAFFLYPSFCKSRERQRKAWLKRCVGAGKFVFIDSW